MGSLFLFKILIKIEPNKIYKNEKVTILFSAVALLDSHHVINVMNAMQMLMV